jgi:hypothetical protein
MQLSLSDHEIDRVPPKLHLRRQTIVRAAEEADVVGIRHTTHRSRLAMIELEPGAGVAAVTFAIDPAAADPITLQCRALRRAQMAW